MIYIYISVRVHICIHHTRSMGVLGWTPIGRGPTPMRCPKKVSLPRAFYPRPAGNGQDMTITSNQKFPIMGHNCLTIN